MQNLLTCDNKVASVSDRIEKNCVLFIKKEDEY
jgi:hypothetical protein